MCRSSLATTCTKQPRVTNQPKAARKNKQVSCSLCPRGPPTQTSSAEGTVAQLLCGGSQAVLGRGQELLDDVVRNVRKLPVNGRAVSVYGR
jgi:hypothetical protein